MMYNNQQVWFLTFADSRYKSANRLYKEAKEFGLFDHISALSERDFERWYFEKYKDRFKDRGFGYWQWKPYLIRRELDKMNEGDILLYCDGGCTLNIEGKKRFWEYIALINSNSVGGGVGALTFEQGLASKDYTKADLFSYLGVLSEKEYTLGNQVNSGIILLRKSCASVSLINDWHYLMHNHYELVTDKDSIIPNLPGFIEHRHDQSVWDILSRKYGVIRVSDCETYAPDGDWSKLKAYPIWQTRRRMRRQSFYYVLKSRLKRVFLK